MINLSVDDAKYLWRLLKDTEPSLLDDIDEEMSTFSSNLDEGDIFIPSITDNLDDLQSLANINREVSILLLEQKEAVRYCKSKEDVEARHKRDTECVEAKRRELKEIIG